MNVYENMPLREFLADVRHQNIHSLRGRPNEGLIRKLDELAAVVDEYDEEALEKAHWAGYEKAEKEAQDDLEDLLKENSTLADRVAQLEAELDDAMRDSQ